MKASCPDCIPVVFLKNCESQLSYILAELFNMCLKESCFPDCWKVSSVVPVMLGKCLLLKTVRLFSVVSEVFENLLNNKIVDSLKKRSFF